MLGKIIIVPVVLFLAVLFIVNRTVGESGEVCKERIDDFETSWPKIPGKNDEIIIASEHGSVVLKIESFGREHKGTKYWADIVSVESQPIYRTCGRLVEETDTDTEKTQVMRREEITMAFDQGKDGWAYGIAKDENGYEMSYQFLSLDKILVAILFTEDGRRIKREIAIPEPKHTPPKNTDTKPKLAKEGDDTPPSQYICN